MVTKMLIDLMHRLEEKYIQDINDDEDIVPQAIAYIDDLHVKLANFQKFFAAIDKSEPDSVGYALRDAGLTEQDLGV